MASNFSKFFRDLYSKAEDLERTSFALSAKVSPGLAQWCRGVKFQITGSQRKATSSKETDTTMHTLEITMLGPTGVGKTSLMAAMYDQFAQNIGKTDLQLTPDEESEGRLLARLSELKSLTDSFKTTNSVSTGQIEQDFTFTLGLQGERPSLRLKFWDYPGMFHGQDSDSRKKEFIRERLSNAVGVLVAIHSPALMERNGCNEVMNNPKKITNLFRSNYENLDSPRLVILAPVLCERYMQNPTSRANLLARVKEEYQELLDFLASSQLQSQVSVVITPVQTVGSVIFSRLEKPEGQARPSFFYRKTGHTAPYAPQDTEQPLRYLLRFVLKLHLAERKSPKLNFSQLFQSNEHLEESLEKFVKGCKDSGGFQVIQGHNLLRL